MLENSKILVPALIGLGMFAQNADICLANNTSILLILFLLLNQKECHHDHHHHEGIEHFGGTIEQRRAFRKGVAVGRALDDDFLEPFNPCGCRPPRNRFEQHVEKELEQIKRCACHNHPHPREGCLI
ncbi:MAG: hypothetical protein FWE01_01870 [Firmicutes bacterium]|nr:hypothetical protein [Bacillota bacterium]